MSKPAGRREVTYEARDIGYGIETGVVLGYWDEQRTNAGGAPAFDVTEWIDHNGEPFGDSPLYLFEDEVVSDEPVVVDMASSASRQHFIDTGDYLRAGEVEED